MNRGKTARGMRVECDKAWEDMVPLANGRDRHCPSCDKAVIDFTNWDSHAMHTWFQEHPDSCGQFRIDQVQRDLVPLPDLSRELVRGAATALAALNLLIAPAQDGTTAPAPTEQAPVQPASHSSSSLLLNTPSDRCWVEKEKEAEIAPAALRKHPRYFLSSRFPFIHRARMVRGKRVIGCPSF